MSRKPLAALSIAALTSVGALVLAGCESDTTVGPSGSVGFDPQRLEMRDTSSRQLTEGEAPPQVIQWFKEEFPKGKITRIEQRRHFRGGDYYVVHFALTDHPGEERVMEYSTGGRD